MGGRVLIPTQDLGRAQEMLFIIYNLKRSGDLPSVPIYYGRSAYDLAKIHDRFLEFRDGFRFAESVVDIFTLENPVDELPEGIYLLPSAKLWPTSISFPVAMEFLSHTVDALFFVGDTGINSPARTILDSQPGEEVELAGRKIRRNCRVEAFDFSGHSHPAHLLQMVKQISPRKLILFHGATAETTATFYNLLRREFRDLEVLAPDEGEALYLD